MSRLTKSSATKSATGWSPSSPTASDRRSIGEVAPDFKHHRRPESSIVRGSVEVDAKHHAVEAVAVHACMQIRVVRTAEETLQVMSCRLRRLAVSSRKHAEVELRDLAPQPSKPCLDRTNNKHADTRTHNKEHEQTNERGQRRAWSEIEQPLCGPRMLPPRPLLPLVLVCVRT